MCKHARRTLAHERVKFTGVIVDAAVTSLCRTEIKWQGRSNCYTDCVVIQVESTGGNWQSKRPFLAEGKINSHERRQVLLMPRKKWFISSGWINALQNALPGGVLEAVIHTGLLVCSQKAKIQNKHETQVKYSAKKVWQNGRIVSSSASPDLKTQQRCKTLKHNKCKQNIV